MPLLVLAGCVDLRVPETTVIRCSDSDEYPPDYLCAPRLERCVPSDVEQLAPALVGEPSITPGDARVGELVVAAFEVDEALAQIPEVRAEPLGLSFALIEQEGQRFRYELHGIGQWRCLLRRR